MRGATSCATIRDCNMAGRIWRMRRSGIRMWLSAWQLVVFWV